MRAMNVLLVPFLVCGGCDGAIAPGDDAGLSVDAPSANDGARAPDATGSGEDALVPDAGADESDSGLLTDAALDQDAWAGCVSAADCAPSSTECRVATCVAGACAEASATDGSSCAVGACQRGLCAEVPDRIVVDPDPPRGAQVFGAHVSRTSDAILVSDLGGLGTPSVVRTLDPSTGTLSVAWTFTGTTLGSYPPMHAGRDRVLVGDAFNGVSFTLAGGVASPTVNARPPENLRLFDGRYTWTAPLSGGATWHALSGDRYVMAGAIGSGVMGVGGRDGRVAVSTLSAVSLHEESGDAFSELATATVDAPAQLFERVAVSGDTVVVVGAPRRGTSAFFVFRREGTSLRLARTVPIPDGLTVSAMDLRPPFLVAGTWGVGLPAPLPVILLDVDTGAMRSVYTRDVYELGRTVTLADGHAVLGGSGSIAIIATR